MAVDQFGINWNETPMRVLEYSESAGKLMAQYGGGGSYHQLVLPTEMVLGGPMSQALDPAMYTIMRYTRSGYYWVDDKLMTYGEMVDHYVDAGKEFKGTWHNRQAYLIERWTDCGHEGHVDWWHEGDALVLFTGKYASQEETQGLLREAKGTDIQRWLYCAVDTFLHEGEKILDLTSDGNS